MNGKPGIRRLITACLLIAGIAGGLSASAQDNPEKQDNIKTLIDKVAQIEEGLKYQAYSQEELADLNKALVDYKTRASDCVAKARDALTKAEAEIKRLGRPESKDTTEGAEQPRPQKEQRTTPEAETKRPGTPDSKDSAEVVEQLKTQEAKRAAAEARFSECTALGLHVDTIHDALKEEMKRRLEEQMLSRGANISELVALNLKHPVAWLAQSTQYIQDKGWLFREASWLQIIGIGITLLVSVLAGLLLRKRAHPWAASRPWSDSHGGRFACAFLTTTFHYAPQLLAALALSLYMWIATHGMESSPMFATLVYALTVLFVINLFIRVILNPVPPGRVLVNVTPEIGTKLSRRLRVLVLLGFLGYLLVGTLFGASLPEYAQSLARRIVRLLLAINIVWVLWLFRHLSGLLGRGWFRHGLTLVAVVAAVADLAGYHNLAGWLLRSVFGTLIVFGLVLMLLRLSREFFAGLEHAPAPWQQRTRELLGMPPTERLVGFFWLRILVHAGLWLFLFWLLVLVWDISSSAVQEIRGFLHEGFHIGFLHIVPIRVVFALVAVIALIALTSWVKGVMKTRLKHTPMERGTRDALITITGYVGVVIAVLVALSVAGIEFSNIALIAGALSVGIGFGLQNIVNNFVSGLILLFERPIKRGDWIVVGNTEGYVSRIRIRSTQIKTFDRADVIIPNSELISGQVTNWMLSDSTGRARIPVGVAYGSDAEKVKEILLKVAADHPDVLTDGPVPQPFVLFRGFGDSSMDFELRCHIGNIDKRLRVISDINFAIDKAFRDNGIVIPFPQRDVHIYGTDGPTHKGED